MAKTFTQIQAAIYDWLQLDTTRLPSATAADIVNIVQRGVCRLYDLSYNEISDTFATVAAQRDYALPSQWSRPHSLWYRDPDNNDVVFLKYLSKERFDLNFPDPTGTDKPSAFALWAGNIQLGSTPSGVLTINRNYYGILDDLVASTKETNRLTNGAWEVLLFLSLVEATEYGIEDERVPLWQAKADRMLKELVIEHRRAKSVAGTAVSEEPG